MSAHTATLEMYIGVKPADDHTLVHVEGFARRVYASHDDAEEMYADAVRLMEADASVKPELRIIDASRRIVRCGEIRVALVDLKRWKAKAA